MNIESAVVFLVTVIGNGLVTWGVVKTELSWLRRDVDRAHDRVNEHDARLRQLERESG